MAITQAKRPNAPIAAKHKRQPRVPPMAPRAPSRPAPIPGPTPTTGRAMTGLALEEHHFRSVEHKQKRIEL